MSLSIAAVRSLRSLSTKRVPALTARNARTFSTSVPRSLSRTWVRNLCFVGSAFAVSSVLVFNSQIGINLDSALVSEEIVLDPDTSIAFPTNLRIPSKVPLPDFTLIGVGVRTVSFLGIKVYSVGLYADLNNPKLAISKFATPEEKLEHIVTTSACVLRIIPTRSTSYTHLRDGFMRALQARLVLCKQRGFLSPEDEQAVQSPLRTFKSMFPTTPLGKHESLDILITEPTSEPRHLIVRDLGAIQNDWIARELVLAYFEGQGLSQKLKQSVFDRLESFKE